MDEEIEIVVTHPKDSRSLSVAVDPRLDAASLLAGLQAGSAKFLSPETPGQPYFLIHKRSGRQFDSSDTMADLDVKSGDILQIWQQGQGAEPC